MLVGAGLARDGCAAVCLTDHIARIASKPAPTRAACAGALPGPAHRASCAAPTLAGIRGEKEQQLNEHTLSMRLERVAAHMPAGARLADIGSDHAYLPVVLLRRGAIAAAVAGEGADAGGAAAGRGLVGDGRSFHEGRSLKFF